MIELCLIESPIFTVKQMEMTGWYLTIAVGYSDHFELEICRCEKDGGPKAIEIKFELSFLGMDGLPLIEKVDLRKFENNDYVEFVEFAAKQEIFFQRREEFLPKNELTIRCQMWRTGTDIGQINSCFARTRLRPDRHSFVWAIRDFITLPRDHERKILLNDCPTNELTLKLYATENDGKEYISISTKACDCGCIVFKICLLDFEGKVVHTVEKSGDSEDDFQITKFFEKRKLIDDTLSLLPNDVMELRLEIEMDAKIVWSKIENYRYLDSKSCPSFECFKGDFFNLMQDEAYNGTFSLTAAMKNLMENGSLSDVTLQTGSKSISAHKCILSARSSVFEDMFTGDMKVKISNYVEINDVDENALQELLFYIYTDRLGKIDWRRAVDLYKAADKHELLDLKRRCAIFLKSDLSVSSVCAILRVADELNDTELREAAQDFVMEQETDFFTTDKWQKFKMENSLLAFDILEQILCKMQRLK